MTTHGCPDNDPEDEQLSCDVHNATRTLILSFFPRCHDPEDQAAILAGIAGALVEIAWLGRREGTGVREIKKMWRELGDSFIDQAPEVYADRRN